MKKLLIYLLFVSGVAAQQIELSGTVSDARTLEPLLGAVLYDTLSQNGTYTDSYGRFYLNIPADRAVVLVSYTGYRTDTLRISRPGRYGFHVKLQPGINLKEVVITARKEKDLLHKPAGRIDLNVKRLENLPYILSEPDPVKLLQKLPGVQPGSEMYGGIYVRGGGADQNLYVVDDVPLYNVFHMGGFVSIFNTDALSRMQLYKSFIPPRYGDRLSSVTDIRMREGSAGKFAGSAMLNLINMKLTLEGPLQKGKTTYLFSARRMPYDLFAKPLMKSLSGGKSWGGYTFYDVNAKITHRFNEKTKLNLSAYAGNDYSDFYFKAGKSLSEEKIRWGNMFAALRLTRNWTPRLMGMHQVAYTRFRLFNRMHEKENGKALYTWDYYTGIGEFLTTHLWDFYAAKSMRFQFGAELSYRIFRPGSLIIDDKTENYYRKYEESRIYRMWETAFSMEWRQKWNRNLLSRAGLRTALYRTGGINFTAWEPRLGLDLKIDQRHAFKTSWIYMSQPVHILTSESLGYPVDLWLPSTPEVSPARAWQASAGFYADYADKHWEWNTEIFYKKMFGLIHYKRGAFYLTTALKNWEEIVHSDGTGTAYGMETMIKKTAGKISGWAGYTWSKALRRFPALYDGKPFPFRYDRRHKIDLVLQYRLKPGKTFSASWVYMSAPPVNIPLERMVLPEEFGSQVFLMDYTITYPGRYVRLEPYHRLDVSYRTSKQKKHGTRTWIFSIYNVYNRRNPLFYFYSDYNPATDDFDPGLYKFSLFMFFPSLGFAFNF